MRVWKLTIGLGALLAVSAAAVTVLGLTAHGQSRRVDGRTITLPPAWMGAEIGASLREVDEGDVTRERLDRPTGAVVEEVRGGSPAEEAGLRAGDIIVEFDGEPVRSARQLGRLVSETPPGRTVAMAVIRQGQGLNLKITPRESRGLASFIPGDAWRRLPPLDLRLPRFNLPEPPEVEVGGRSGSGRLGIGVSDLTTQLAEYFGVADGVLVTSVTADSAAARGGIRAGDVIVSIDREPVTGAAALQRRIRDAKSDSEVVLGIVRDRKEISVAVKPDPRPGRTRGLPV